MKKVVGNDEEEYMKYSVLAWGKREYDMKCILLLRKPFFEIMENCCYIKRGVNWKAIKRMKEMHFLFIQDIIAAQSDSTLLETLPR